MGNALTTVSIPEEAQEAILLVILRFVEDGRLGGEPLQGLLDLTDDLSNANGDQVSITSVSSYAGLHAISKVIEAIIKDIKNEKGTD